MLQIVALYFSRLGCRKQGPCKDKVPDELHKRSPTTAQRFDVEFQFAEIQNVDPPMLCRRDKL
jgi:hypothetical protein